MTHPKSHALQVLITSGPEALDRAVLGFAFALSATTCGADVTVVLALEGITWIKKDTPEAHQTVNGFASVADYMTLLADGGAVVRLCSSCVEHDCALDRPTESAAEKISYAGLTELALRTIRGDAATVVF
jgi:predicted peroxiredoxin